MPTDKLAIIIRVKPELKTALQDRANAEGRTLTNLIEHAATTYLAQAGKAADGGKARPVRRK